jgi:hypothetical protein
VLACSSQIERGWLVMRESAIYMNVTPTGATAGSSKTT